MLGIDIAIVELFLFFSTAYTFRIYNKPLKNIDDISYYWLSFTILTFIWETSFIINYKDIHNYSWYLLKNNENVWKNKYSLSYIIPWDMAKIFYSEYAAYADREYMLLTNDWSRVIESTHAYICGISSIMALSYKLKSNHNKFLIAASISMGSQLMNSILYMSNYLIQINDPYNVNYCTNFFKCGYMLTNRPFMYINLVWTLMPSYVLWKLINRKKRGEIKFNIKRYLSILSSKKTRFNKKIGKYISNFPCDIHEDTIYGNFPYYQQ